MLANRTLSTVLIASNPISHFIAMETENPENLHTLEERDGLELRLLKARLDHS